MDGIKGLLTLYTSKKSKTYDTWGTSSCQIAISFKKGCYCAHQLCRLAHQFIKDQTVLPVNPYRNWNKSMLVDEDLVNVINLYLQELGSTITAAKLVEFLVCEDVKLKHGITHTIGEKTACCYLILLAECEKGTICGWPWMGRHHLV